MSDTLINYETAEELYRHLLKMRGEIEVTCLGTRDPHHVKFLAKLMESLDTKLVNLRAVVSEERSNPSNPAIISGIVSIVSEPIHMVQSLETYPSTGLYRVDGGPWQQAERDIHENGDFLFPEVEAMTREELGPVAQFLSDLKFKYGFAVSAYRVDSMDEAFEKHPEAVHSSFGYREF